MEYYIGQTRRNLHTRLKEHERCMKDVYIHRNKEQNKTKGLFGKIFSPYLDCGYSGPI